MATLTGNFVSLAAPLLSVTTTSIERKTLSPINMFLATSSVQVQEEVGSGFAPRTQANNASFNWGH